MPSVWRAWGGARRLWRHMGGLWVPVALVAVVVLGQLAAPWTASAEEKRNFAYPYGWVYKAAYRMLKIDLGCPIEEADKETGFILFSYEYQGVKSPASIEIMDLTSEEEGYAVNARVKMNKLPSWVEQDLLDQLEAKLADEYGPPPTFKKKDKPQPPPEDEGEAEDEGEDDDDSKGQGE